MKILLSAYACEPGKGSEPEVGWAWANALAKRGYEVWVITRKNNRSAIESELRNHRISNLHFIYFDLPKIVVALKKLFGTNLYYCLWQLAALNTARKAHDANAFDKAIHVTFGVIRFPSFLRRLPIPYVYGPVAGFEFVPPNLLATLPMSARIAEIAREFATKLLFRLPSNQETLANAEVIVAATKETEAFLREHGYGNVVQHLAVITPPFETADFARQDFVAPASIRCAYVGRLTAWKGLGVALRAIAATRRNNTNATLTLYGTGPLLTDLRKLAAELSIADQVHFAGWMPRPRLAEAYLQNDVLLFPSLREAGGMVVLEAMHFGMPTICIAYGGPGEIVTEQVGISISPQADVSAIQQIACAISRLANSRTEYVQKSKHATLHCQQYSVEHLVDSLNLYLLSNSTPLERAPGKQRNAVRQ